MFTRKELKKIFSDADIEVPKDVLTQICDLHTSANDDLVEAHKKEIEELKETMENGEETVKKSEYDKISKELETLKTDIANKETRQAKVSALQEMYKGLGLPDNMLKVAIKATDVDSIELDKDGKIKDVESLKTQATEDWGNVLEHKEDKGVPTPNPPATEDKGTDLGSLSMEDYIKARKK